MNFKPEPALWSRDTGQDTLFWLLSTDHNMDVQYQRYAYTL